jgi:transcription elongation GreA/GreB family factor
MTSDPLSAALKEISEARHLLESLLTASENFEYHRAKSVLKKLNRKVRDLARLQASYSQMEKLRAPNLHVLNFEPPSPVAPTRAGVTGS